MNASAVQLFGFGEACPAGPVPAAALADLPAKIQLRPENVRNGLAQLVLTLVELLRELLERQACGASTPARLPREKWSGWERLSCGWPRKSTD